MIAFENITLRVQHQTLLEGTGLQVADGDKVVLHGASGSGKSSLLKCAVGALPVAAGTVRIDGMELSAGSVAQIRSRIAFIGQEPVLGAETVRDAVLLPFTYRAHRHQRPALADILVLLERLHLPDTILDKPCARISGGEKQRIAVLRALLLDKRIFFADEVTSALDPASKTAVMDELFRPGITLLSVSHDTEWIGRSTRRVSIEDRQLKEMAR